MKSEGDTQKESLLTPAMILGFLSAKKEELRERYHIKDIGLFGSYSRGDYRADSDVDIIYVLQAGAKFGYFEYWELDEMLSRSFNNKRIELVNYQYMNPIIKQRGLFLWAVWRGE